MDEPQRPFACTIEGCDLRFTNEDHLNWHHKKHEMILNLGLANKNSELADQTPTPTRFIRNCEEVGLFQDLQNVNPFDETFKKAIENTKNGCTLHVPETNTDDTLHTPHILPHHVEENIPTIRQTESPDILYVIPSNETKNKLKATIINKETKKKLNVASIDKINKKLATENIEESSKNPNEKLPRRTVKGRSDRDDIEKIREMNRAAQNRCRKRKRVQQKQMEEDYMFYKNENNRLNLENENYKHKFELLKKLIEAHKSSGNHLVNEIDKILNAPLLQLPIKKPSEVKPNKLVPLMKKNTEPNGSPMLIQVVGNISKLAVSVLPK